MFGVIYGLSIDSISSEKNKVIDGDTLIINDIRYRLYGIDAPEIKQKCNDSRGKDYFCGKKAKTFMHSMIVNKNVKCNKKDKDKYQRILAICFVGKKNLNKLMVRSGWALAYTFFSKDYVNDENYANRNNLGIWNGNFVKPWEWRRKKRLKTKNIKKN